MNNKERIESIKRLESVEEVREIRDEAVRHATRIGSGAKFDMSSHIEHKIRHGEVFYLEQLFVERGTEISEDTIDSIKDMASVIASDLEKANADRADYTTYSVHLDLSGPSTLMDGFDLHFRKDRINEIVDFLTTREGKSPAKKGAEPFNVVVAEYCALHNDNMFQFCEKCIELLDSESEDGDENRRRADHYAFLEVAKIRYIMDNKKRYKKLFQQKVFFEENPMLTVTVGETELVYEVLENMTLQLKK